MLAHPCGGRIAAKNTTIATVGLVPQILRFARERQPYRLIVSLTSAIDERRRSLLPSASAWPVRELADAVRIYQQSAGRLAAIVWAVLRVVNTGSDRVAVMRKT